jgi:enoyl-CoA hydratase/carnithine racemase
MTKIITEDCGNVAILRLNNGVTNAINPHLVNDINESLREIRAKYKGMVLAGGEKFFSIGLDLPALLKLDRIAMTDFWYKFNQLTLELFTVPLPTVCAISGHTIAGGTVLALTCDFRFATSEKKQIGLNEIKLGLPVPCVPDLILRQIVGDRSSIEMVYHGEFMSLSDANQIGLIDNICSPKTVEEQAVKKASELAAFQGKAFAAIKANRVEAIKLRYEINYKSTNEIFLDCWFSEPVQKLLKEASRKF